MAQSERTQRPQFSQPVRQISLMLIVLGLTGFGAFLALPSVYPIFAANPYLNGFIIFVFMWFRWSFPRLRVDQLMRLEWKVLLPVGFVNLLLASAAVLYQLYLFPGTGVAAQ